MQGILYFPYITPTDLTSTRKTDMNKRTVRITPLTGLWLLLLWGLPYWSARTGYAVREAQLERKAQEAMVGLSDDQLFHFSIHRRDSARLFHWEHSREFEYQTQMFDVARRELRGDTLHLWCYWDAGETELKRAEAKAVRDTTSDSTLPLAWLLQWVQVWLVPGGNLLLPIPDEIGSNALHYLATHLPPGFEPLWWRPPIDLMR